MRMLSQKFFNCFERLVYIQILNYKLHRDHFGISFFRVDYGKSLKNHLHYQKTALDFATVVKD